MKTYRVVIEYTTAGDLQADNPNYWDWPELLNLPRTATFGIWVDNAPLNKDQARDIARYMMEEE
jgi:hypothetical protein